MATTREDKELRELEEELNIQILPGTEVMRDVGSHHFVKSGQGVLVPQPSDDPHDPLNWSTFWKFSTMTCVTMMAFFQGMGPLSLAPMFPQLIRDFDSDLAGVVQFTGVCILVLGFSNFIWVPIATTFGRRPALLASSLVCLGSNIWRAQAQTYSSFMGACVVNGIGAGPAETLQPAVIADMMFLHERGTYNTMYFFFYWTSLMIGPIIAGVMADRVGWRNFWWLNVAAHAFVFLISLFGFPETKWPRRHVVTEQHPSLMGKDSPVTDHQEASTMAEDGISRIENEKQSDVLTKQATAMRDPYLGKGTPAKWQFKLFQTNPHWFKTMLLDIWIPWKMFAFPIVEFASFVVSWSASCFLTLNLTQSQVFAEPPYNFSSEAVGFTNFAIFGGGIIGLVTAGPLSDWISARLTKRNNGIREPEMRLLTMVPYVCIMILGNFIVAFGYQYHWDWKLIVILGYGCAGLQVAALPSITSTYAVDSYKPVAGSLFVAITVNKNVWGYGFAAFITPWTEAAGFIKPIMTNMSLTALWCLFGIVFWFFGKKCRYWTRNSKVHSM